MPRWLVTSVFAVLLCCHGFAAFAQDLVGADRHRGDAVHALIADPSAPSVSDHKPADRDFGASLSHDAWDLDDTGVAISSGHMSFDLPGHPEPLPQLTAMFRSSMFLERPMRPPRSVALLA